MRTIAVPIVLWECDCINLLFPSTDESVAFGMRVGVVLQALTFYLRISLPLATADATMLLMLPVPNRRSGPCRFRWRPDRAQRPAWWCSSRSAGAAIAAAASDRWACNGFLGISVGITEWVANGANGAIAMGEIVFCCGGSSVVVLISFTCYIHNSMKIENIFSMWMNVNVHVRKCTGLGKFRDYPSTHNLITTNCACLPIAFQNHFC